MYAIALFMQQIIYASENGQLDSDTKKDECSSSSDTALDTELEVVNPPTQTEPRAEMTYIDLAVEFFCCNALFQGSSVQTIDLYKKGVLEAKNEEEFSSILENLRESLRQDEGFKVFFAIQFTVANYANDEKKLECIRNVFEKAEKIECSESVCELMKVGICEANTVDEFLMVYKKLAAKLGPVHGLAVFRVINYTMAYYTKEETKIKNMLEALSKVKETDAIKTTLELFKNKACGANDDKTVFKELLADCKKKFSSKYGFYVFAAIDIVSDNYKKSEMELLKILRGVIYLAIKKKKQGIMDMFFEELYEGSSLMQIHDICQKMNGCFRDEDDVDSVLCAMVFTIADKNPENMKKMIRALRKMELPNDFLCIDIEMTEENFLEKLYYYIGDYKLCDDSDQKTKIVGLIKENINVLMQVEQLNEEDKQELEANEKELRKLAVDEKEYAVMLKFMSDSASLISNAMDQIKPMETCYIGHLQNNKDYLKRKSELEDEYELVESDETDTTVGSENKKKSIEEEYNERFSDFRVSNRIYSKNY